MPVNANFIYKIPKDASYVTLRNQNRMLYANYRIQQNNTQEGCQGVMRLQNGNVADADLIPKLLEGARETTVAEIQLDISSNACPVAVAVSAVTPSPVTPTLKLYILGDTNVSTVTSTIQSRLTALGYTTATINSVQLGTTYTGSDLNVSTYNTVLFFTNASQTGAAALSTNLKNFVNAGGNLVTATFAWNLYPSGFDATITPFQLRAQSNDSTGNMTVDVVNPITTGVNTSLTGGALVPNNGAVSLQSGATKIATYTTSGAPLVAINTIGSSRTVGLNITVNTISVYPNLRNLTVNALLWACSILT
jgi:hypothetical protein